MTSSTVFSCEDSVNESNLESRLPRASTLFLHQSLIGRQELLRALTHETSLESPFRIHCPSFVWQPSSWAYAKAKIVAILATEKSDPITIDNGHRVRPPLFLTDEWDPSITLTAADLLFAAEEIFQVTNIERGAHTIQAWNMIFSDSCQIKWTSYSEISWVVVSRMRR